jgi:hypothetical protein
MLVNRFAPVVMRLLRRSIAVFHWPALVWPAPADL